MSNLDYLKKICHVNGNKKGEYFVGFKFEENDPKIYFPIGFQLSNDLMNLKKDIRLLINILSSFAYKKGNLTMTNTYNNTFNSCLIQSYFDVIDYFIENGYRYYFEIDKKYKVDTKGKIIWKKTIKTQKAIIQNNNPIYLKFVVQNKFIFSNQLITKIHEYCVYQAYQYIGWYYSLLELNEPQLIVNKKNRNIIISELNKKIEDTHIEKDKRLFISMKAIVEEKDYKELKDKFDYGTNDFDIVWEKMIDRMFGIRDKEKYFPRSQWDERISFDKNYNKKPLIPDSIMILRDEYDVERGYILDSKYYKYGISHSTVDLPGTSDISKQITYGEYIKKHLKKFTSDDSLFNAFIIPFNSLNNTFKTSNHFINVAEGYGLWRNKDKECLDNYEKIQAILVDTKYVMQNYLKNNECDKKELALCIEKFKNGNR